VKGMLTCMLGQLDVQRGLGAKAGEV
jgi:hypothetical protein